MTDLSPEAKGSEEPKEEKVESLPASELGHEEVEVKTEFALFSEKLKKVRAMETEDGKKEAKKILQTVPKLSDILQRRMLENSPSPVYLLNLYTKILEKFEDNTTLHVHVAIKPPDVRKLDTTDSSQPKYVIGHGTWTHGLYEFIAAHGLSCRVVSERQMLVFWSGTPHPLSNGFHVTSGLQ